MVTTEQVWIDLMHYWHIHNAGSWVINKHDRVRQCMNKMNSNGIKPHKEGMSSHDFSSMYTTLDHKILLQLLDEFIDLVFTTEHTKSANRRILLLKKGGTFEWTNKKASEDTRTTQHFDARRLKGWIHYLINNMYVEVGGALFQQVVGIPMGTNSAPMIANLSLFMAEFNYIKGIANNIRHVGDKQWVLLRQLSYCNRFIDDLLNLCVERDGQHGFNGIALKIYSKIGLKITDETGSNPHQIDYLDMTIWYDKEQKMMVSKLFDKRVGLAKKGLQMNRFPHVDSCLSAQCKYGIVTSQCHRFMKACSLPKHFLRAAVDLRETFIAKGYQAKPLDKLFKRFIQQHRQQLRFMPDAVKMKHQHESNQLNMRREHKHKTVSNSNTTTRTNTSTVVVTTTDEIEPILGRRKMGSTWYYLVQGGRQNTWQAAPEASRQTDTKQMEYLACRSNKTLIWVKEDKVPLLPCPGLIHPEITVTAEGQQRILKERKRAKQQQHNIAIARASVALVQFQLEAAKTWPTPAAPEQEDPEVRQQMIQDEYNDYFHPRRDRTAPTEDQRRRTELEDNLRIQAIPTDPQQQEAHYFDGDRGHFTATGLLDTHQNVHGLEGVFSGLNLKD